MYKNNDVVTVKLTNGEEFIGRIDLNHGDHDQTIKLSKPCMVMMHQEGFGLAPVALTADPDTPIYLDYKDILFTTKTYQEIASKYLQQTTGLVL